VARASRQIELTLPTWGGRRKGAGRKPGPGRPSVPHRRRALHEPRCPAHVTLRASSGVVSLRSERIVESVRSGLVTACRPGFRVLHFSVQADHLHLLAEADTQTGFDRGMRGLAVRVAKAVNRARGRPGRVWADRYHARLLRTPREVRNALVYVLNNVRKHLARVRGVDPCSSARWFDGWKGFRVLGASPLPRARTWLAAVGWRRRGLIDLDETPCRPSR
jgi:REP element-mobilizing transposase RayT